MAGLEGLSAAEREYLMRMMGLGVDDTTSSDDDVDDDEDDDSDDSDFGHYGVGRGGEPVSYAHALEVLLGGGGMPPDDSDSEEDDDSSDDDDDDSDDAAAAAALFGVSTTSDSDSSSTSSDEDSDEDDEGHFEYFHDSRHRAAFQIGHVLTSDEEDYVRDQFVGKGYFQEPYYMEEGGPVARVMDFDLDELTTELTAAGSSSADRARAANALAVLLDCHNRQTNEAVLRTPGLIEALAEMVTGGFTANQRPRWTPGRESAAACLHALALLSPAARQQVVATDAAGLLLAGMAGSSGQDDTCLPTLRALTGLRRRKPIFRRCRHDVVAPPPSAQAAAGGASASASGTTQSATTVQEGLTEDVLHGRSGNLIRHWADDNSKSTFYKGAGAVFAAKSTVMAPAVVLFLIDALFNQSPLQAPAFADNPRAADICDGLRAGSRNYGTLNPQLERIFEATISLIGDDNANNNDDEDDDDDKKKKKNTKQTPADSARPAPAAAAAAKAKPASARAAGAAGGAAAASVVDAMSEAEEAALAQRAAAAVAAAEAEVAATAELLRRQQQNRQRGGRGGRGGRGRNRRRRG